MKTIAGSMKTSFLVPQPTTPMNRLSAMIYENCEAANDAVGPCPKALAESDGGHLWHIAEAEAKNWKHYFLFCECKNCPQKMKLSADAEQYPL
jgi:hypothetical protein